MNDAKSQTMALVVKAVGDAAGWVEQQQSRKVRQRRLRRLRWRHRLDRLVRALLAAAVTVFAGAATSFFVGGLGVEGVIATVALAFVVFVLFAVFPRSSSLTDRASAGPGLAALTERTQVWLEAQRPLLPLPAQRRIDRISADLEHLAPHLPGLNPEEPLARDIDRLLREHLPVMVDTYQNIPEPLRQRPHAGSTPIAQLEQGLDVIADQVETATSRIARGQLDALATRGRYLDARYAERETFDGA